MADTSTVNLKCSIYPIRDFTTANFMFGYNVSDAPLDTNSAYVPFNDDLFSNIIMAGHRPYRKFDDLASIDLTEAIKSISNLSTVNITVNELKDMRRRDISLVKQDRILQENYYDCDSPVFDNIPITNFPILGFSDTKLEDLKYSVIWQEISDGSNQLSLTIDDGTVSPSYDFVSSWDNLKADPITGQYYFSFDVTSTPTGAESNATKMAAYTIRNAIKNGEFGVAVGTPDKIRGKNEDLKYATRKASFQFTTKSQTYSELIQFQSLTLGDKFGVLIYENGETVTQDLNDGILNTLIAKFDDVLFKGYCQVSGINEETNEVNWSGYWYQIPKVSNFMNLIKYQQYIDNPSFDSGVTGWTANGAATVVYDSTNKRAQLGALAALADFVVIDLSILSSIGDKYGISFEVFNYASGTAIVHIFFTGVTPTVFDIKITGNGKYSFINDTLTSVTPLSAKVYVKTAGTATAFDVDNVEIWSIG